MDVDALARERMRVGQRVDGVGVLGAHGVGDLDDRQARSAWSSSRSRRRTPPRCRTHGTRAARRRALRSGRRRSQDLLVEDSAGLSRSCSGSTAATRQGFRPAARGFTSHSGGRAIADEAPVRVREDRALEHGVVVRVLDDEVRARVDRLAHDPVVAAVIPARVDSQREALRRSGPASCSRRRRPRRASVVRAMAARRGRARDSRAGAS